MWSHATSQRSYYIFVKTFNLNESASDFVNFYTVYCEPCIFYYYIIYTLLGKVSLSEVGTHTLPT